jgi:hypothetical protein
MTEQDNPQDSSSSQPLGDTTKAPSFILRPVVREIEETMRGEFSESNVIELWERLQKICFEACILTPEWRLTSAQANCLARCVDRWLDVQNLVGMHYYRTLASPGEVEEEKLKKRTKPKSQRNRSDKFAKIE